MVDLLSSLVVGYLFPFGCVQTLSMCGGPAEKVTESVWLIRLCTEPSYHPGLSPHELKFGCLFLLFTVLPSFFQIG